MPYKGFPEYKAGKLFQCPKDLGNILNSSQIFLEKLCGNNNVMNDTKRKKMFGNVFGKSFDNSCITKFEYLDIFVEKDGLLNRYCDYSNDYREGYDYGASYSYLIKKQDKDEIYRVNFIMVTRMHVAVFMDEIRYINDI